MTNDEMYLMAKRVQQNSGSCCLFVARNALELNNWDEERAIAFLKEKKRLGDDFDINEFRRRYSK